MELDQLFSLPAHPLLVHIPVVLVPLAALGVVLLAVRPRWIRSYGPIVVAVALAGAVGAVLAAGSGEALEESVAASRALVHDHAEAGDLARALALVLLAAAVALVAVDWFGRRRAAASSEPAAAGSVASGGGNGGAAVPRWVSIGVSVIAVSAAVGSVVAVVDAGHSGAKAVWHGTDVSSGESRGGDDDGD